MMTRQKFLEEFIEAMIKLNFVIDKIDYPTVEMIDANDNRYQVNAAIIYNKYKDNIVTFEEIIEYIKNSLSGSNDSVSELDDDQSVDSKPCLSTELKFEHKQQESQRFKISKSFSSRSISNFLEVDDSEIYRYVYTQLRSNEEVTKKINYNLHKLLIKTKFLEGINKYLVVSGPKGIIYPTDVSCISDNVDIVWATAIENNIKLLTDSLANGNLETFSYSEFGGSVLSILSCDDYLSTSRFLALQYLIDTDYVIAWLPNHNTLVYSTNIKDMDFICAIMNKIAVEYTSSGVATQFIPYPIFANYSTGEYILIDNIFKLRNIINNLY